MDVSSGTSALRDDTVFDDGALRIIRTDWPPGLAIAGEIDEFAYPALVSALAGFAGEPGAIYVDLSDVAFCDLAGLRVIVGLTGASHHSSLGTRPVVLHGVPAYLKVVLRIVGWDSTPGLFLHEGPRPGR